MINARAEGGAYHRVMVDGREWSKHTTDYKAAEVAYDVALAGLDHFRRGVIPAVPVVYVTSDRRVYYEPDPQQDDVTIPAPGGPIVSDGGEDIVDFFHRNFPPPADMPVVSGETIYSGLDAFLDRSKEPGRWKIDARYLRAPDGSDVPFALAWRGFGLLMHRRDRNAIRLNIGGAS